LSECHESLSKFSQVYKNWQDDILKNIQALNHDWLKLASIAMYFLGIVATNLINKMGKSHPKTSITLCKTAGFSFIKAILDCITIIIIIILIIIITHAHGSHVSIVIICLCDSLCLV